MTHTINTTISRKLPSRRFSEGVELQPAPPSNARIGRFSDGIADARADAAIRAGRYDDGVATWPDAPARRRVGSFADGAERVPGMRAATPPSDARPARVTERPAERRAA